MITIPNLELCGAVLLTQLYNEVINALGLKPDQTIFWCDSTIVLHWFRTEPHRLKVFVANRLAEIQAHTDVDRWRNVQSEENPADALSRGQLPEILRQNVMWFRGPPWLSKDEREWPNSVLPMIKIPELKQTACLLQGHAPMCEIGF